MGRPESTIEGYRRGGGWGTSVKVLPFQMVLINVYGVNHDESVSPDAAASNPARHASATKGQERPGCPLGWGPVAASLAHRPH